MPKRTVRSAIATTSERDLLGILSIHPMKEAAVRSYLDEIDASWDIAADLLQSGRLLRIDYGGVPFLVRRSGSPGRAGAATH